MIDARVSPRLPVSASVLGSGSSRAALASTINLPGRLGAPDISGEDVVRAVLRRSGRVTLRSERRLATIVAEVAQRLTDCLRDGGRAYVAGNGGSAADAQHFAAEFTGKFHLDRDPLPVISLTTDTSVLTCIANDYGFTEVFARQLTALGRPGDLFFALSTSGGSENVVAACHAARRLGMTVISLTGRGGGAVAALSDVALCIPSGQTAHVQETSIAILHGICNAVEQSLGLGEHPADTDRVELDPASLPQAREAWRREGLAVVTTSGPFDVIDAHQLAGLWAASDLGDLLVVLLHSDELIRLRRASGPPANNQRDRANVLGSLVPVDHVVMLTPDAADDVVDLLAPAIAYQGGL